MLVSPSASSTLGGNDSFIGMLKVMHQHAGLVVVQDRADRHFQNGVHAFPAAAIGAFSMTPPLALMFGVEAEVNQGVVSFARFHDDIAAAAAISSGGSAAGNKLLPPEGNAAVAAIPCLHPDSCLIDEHRDPNFQCSGYGSSAFHRQEKAGVAHSSLLLS